MSRLTVYPDNNPAAPELVTEDGAEIARVLNGIGVVFERWDVSSPLPQDADDAAVLNAYSKDVERIKRDGGYESVDVLRVLPNHPDKVALRQKFLNEHTHSEDEVRFFVEGSGMFYLRVGGKVYMTLCTARDFISVPNGVTHWFDMGAEPTITALRFFENTAGWVPNFTGTDIAAQFPKYETDHAA